MLRVSVLGIGVDALTRGEAIARCEMFLQSEGLYHIVTANPELVLAASRDASVREALGKGSLVVPDGAGLRWAARQYGQSLPERIPGVELLVDLCHLAARRRVPVYLLGGRGVADTAAEALRRRVPGLVVAAYAADHHAGAPPPELWTELERLRPAVLLVAYGASRQELWIQTHRERLAAVGVHVAMGVGGAFDTLSGRLPRAPWWMRERGLEWLWRLMLEPRRFPRILRATFVFPFRVLRDRQQVNPRARP